MFCKNRQCERFSQFEILCKKCWLKQIDTKFGQLNNPQTPGRNAGFKLQESYFTKNTVFHNMQVCTSHSEVMSLYVYNWVVMMQQNESKLKQRLH